MKSHLGKNRRLNLWAVALGLSLILMGAGSAFSSEPLKVGDKAPNFTLQDADDKTYELAKMKGNVVVLFMGSRKLRDENRKWAKALRDAFPENEKLKILGLSSRRRIEIFMVADMRGIPFFITRGFIKRRIKKDKPPVPLLLDWKQKVNKLFGTKKDKINIFVIDAQGLVAHVQQNKTYSKEDFEKLKPKVEAVLSKKVSKQRSEGVKG